jgi:TPR repeat protein
VLVAYIVMQNVFDGIGCVKDEKLAFELYKLNWEQNKCVSSLYNYAYCLRYGIGCVKDVALANALRQSLKN